MKVTLSIEQTLAQAFAHLDAGRAAEARRLARALEAARPEPAALSYLLGLLALQEGQGRKAAQHLRRAVARSPGALPPLLALARAQSQQGRNDEAAATWRRAVTLAPDLAVAWQRIGEQSLAAGRLAAAHAPLAIAGRLAPDQPGLRNNLGIAARAAGQIERAAGHFRAAILLDPGFAKPYANLAGLRRHLRQPAVADAARAVCLVADGAALLELGQAWLAQGDAAAARDHFAGAAAQLPSQPEPIWLRIEALRRLGQDDHAIALARRLLALDPADRFGAALALAQLGAAPLPERAPAAQVARLYDQYAASFDANLLGDLAYRAPALVMDALDRLGRRGPFVAFDAGCGTGLMGAVLQPRCSRLDGADLSAAMVARAARRGVYDELVVGDLLAELTARPHFYDLVVAADVLIHLGDLRPVAAAAAAALLPGGAFAFTVERAEADEVVLRASGRFAHGESHLRAAAAAAGLTVDLCEAVATREDAGRPVPGLLCVMARP